MHVDWSTSTTFLSLSRSSSPESGSTWPRHRSAPPCRRRLTSSAPPAAQPESRARLDLRGVLTRWGRLGILGVGGPQAHTALLREMMVEREQWLSAREFQDAVAATSLLPGPASTQLAIFCARAVAGIRGAIVGGLAFIVPGFVLIVILAELFLAHGRNDAVRGRSEEHTSELQS